MGYFKPLRRKFGMVTLLMACVLMCTWFRNQNDYHEYVFHGENEPPSLVKHRTRRYVIVLTGGKFILCYVRNDADYDIAGPFDEASPNKPVGINIVGTIYATRIPIEREFKYCGIEITKRATIGFADSLPIEVTSVAISLVVVALPLTLLSAWLMLSKPRAKPDDNRNHRIGQSP